MAHSSGKLNPFAAFLMYAGLGLVVLSFLVISGIANVNVWWNSAEGWNRYVFTTIAIGAEAWGALGLLLLTLRFAQRQWLKAFICLALWIPSVGFNGYSTYRYFTIQTAEVGLDGAGASTALKLAQDRIPEITTELDTIGVTRTPEAITLERDQLPNNYRTRRSELEAELATANRRAALEEELKGARQTVLDNAGADMTPETKTISDGRIWIALVIWMEAIKALALWVMFGRTEKPRKAAEEQNALPEPETQEIVETAPTAPAIAEIDENSRVVEGPDGTKRVIRAV